MKVKEIKNPDESHHSWAIKCPGCGDYHCYDNRWTFNGDMERPTFTPSMKSTYEHGEPKITHVCHSFVTDGRIQFLSDCTHSMKGQTVDLSDVPADWNEEK